MELIFLLSLVIGASLYDFGDSVYGNLDPSWYPWLQNKCGKNFQSNGFPPRSARSTGGRKAQKDEFPWAVAIATNLQYCSGVLISPRHVLTAAHCVVNINDIVCLLFREMNFTHEERTKFFPYQPLSKDKINVYIGASNLRPSVGEHYLWPIVMNITIHPNFDACNLFHDLALLEFTPNALNRGSPICMPHHYDKIPYRVTFSGFGYNPKHPKELRLEAVNLTINQRATTTLPHQKLVTITPERGICGGDSGGPLFKWNGTRNVLLGTASSYFGCDGHTANSDRISVFEDITLRVQWVCQNSGVCPF